MTRRAAIVVLDGVGVGAAPDASAYGDVGSDTLGNVARSVGGMSLPALEKAGLGNITRIEGVAPSRTPAGAWGLMEPASSGKDSTAGHWEIAGVHLARPFPTYAHGFPAEVVREFERRTGRAIIGNVVGSGTDVIDRFGAEHQRTGSWILYTSADSVFQLAAHEETIALAEQYRGCEIAREMLVAPVVDELRVMAKPRGRERAVTWRAVAREERGEREARPGVAGERLDLDRGLPLHLLAHPRHAGRIEPDPRVPPADLHRVEPRGPVR